MLVVKMVTASMLTKKILDVDVRDNGITKTVGIVGMVGLVMTAEMVLMTDGPTLC